MDSKVAVIKAFIPYTGSLLIVTLSLPVIIACSPIHIPIGKNPRVIPITFIFSSEFSLRRFTSINSDFILFLFKRFIISNNYFPLIGSLYLILKWSIISTSKKTDLNSNDPYYLYHYSHQQHSSELFQLIQYQQTLHSDKPHRFNKLRSIRESLIGEIVSTSKGFNPHNYLRQWTTNYLIKKFQLRIFLK